MKSEEEIREKFNQLITSREKCAPGSAARRYLNRRVLILGWVLDHPEAPELELSEDAIKLLGCVG